MAFADGRGDSPAHHPTASCGSAPEVVFRLPRPEDGPVVTRLIAQCPPLDANSAYCHLLQCTHFAESCVLAESAGTPAGWLSAYCPPAAPDTLFVWQIAVPSAMRGKGIGGRMLHALLRRPALRGVTAVEATITQDNAASWALFRRFARDLGAGLARQALFERRTHFAGKHATEHLVRIGPLAGRPGTRQHKEER